MQPLTPKRLSQFHRRLHAWYKANGRHHLPWRNTDDPYAIYISEVMLQQTQVATVLERYYFPFLKRFPTLKHLAIAPRQEVLSAWQGLGYYNRAANLHQAAIDSKGHLPQSPQELMQLPGIGQNTAHAIAAFAYRQPVAILEANVKRVVARIFALKHPGTAEWWDKATALLDSKNPFDYNQAMMDLGSLICTPRAPKCGICPANSICEGQIEPECYPQKTIRKKTPVRRKKIILFYDAKNRYFATPRKTRLLQGLYQFVETDGDATTITFQNRQYTLAREDYIEQIRQQYSHFTLQAELYRIRALTPEAKDWHSLATLKKLPLSKAEEKMLALIEAHI